MKFINSIAKRFLAILTKNFRLENGAKDSKTVQRSALCRSRRELSNEFLSMSPFLIFFSKQIEIQTSIYLQKSASIQPRTSPSKFGGNYSILFNRVLRPEAGGQRGGPSV